ncbi:MAG: hypothetical protein OEZ54_06305, partial [Gemmatimonadota bacterium]|nr:hypothetical protein [Gemmatimonadota bacterium]
MKRKSSWLLISGVCFTIWGCEAFSPHPEFVARVGIHEMPVTSLADLFVHGEALRVNRRVADEMVRHWIDVALVAGMAAGGDSLMSEEFITEFMWPDIRGFQIAEFKERLYAENVNVDSAVVDSVFWRSDVRFLAHILRGVRLEDGPEVRATQRANAEAMHSA